MSGAAHAELAMVVTQACWPFRQPPPSGLALRSLRLDGSTTWEQTSVLNERCLEQALPPRRREFTAGRLCAVAALADLGMEPAWLAIAQPYRYARFPLGVVGSISHAQNLALACAADAHYYAGVGVDAEPIALHPELWGMVEQVMTSHERACLESMSKAQALRFFYLSFSAKEAFYKAVYPLCHTDMEFSEAELAAWDLQGRFQLRLTSARIAPHFIQGQLFEGYWTERDNTMLTLLAIGRNTHRVSEQSELHKGELAGS
ncbi:4'-phosphopantetheinyl transferase superfamily protein [Pseudomonas sp.]|uniref:4'-phosphopantetheinyl transferase family protein n=1 Tax=Pseudomonas sp. TaxID=306 RepID=UPI0031E3316F